MIIQKNKDFYSSTKLSQNNVFHGFGTKMLTSLNFDEKSRVLTMQQTHSNHVIHAKKPYRTIYNDTDGLLTSDLGIYLKVVTADCTPIFFYDPVTNFIGIVHAGWKGTYQGILKKMVRRFVKNGSKSRNICVALGPCIGACCYEVFGERLLLIKEKFPKFAADIIVEHDVSEKSSIARKTHLNLLALHIYQLVSLGVRRSNIDYRIFCTACQSDQFFSYNKDKTNERLLSFIVR